MNCVTKEYDLCLPWEANEDLQVLKRVRDEFLFRLNPHWIITGFTSSSPAYDAEIVDHETSTPAALRGEIVRGSGALLAITSDSGEWEKITFFIKNNTLHAEVRYCEGPPEDLERKMVLWLRSIQQYLRLYRTDSLNTRFFRLLMNRVILPMTPSQRKISLMLVRLTVLELLVIVLIVVGWFFFFR